MTIEVAKDFLTSEISDQMGTKVLSNHTAIIPLCVDQPNN